MLEYQIPGIMDIPEIEAIFVDKADPKINNTGTRGLGEPPIIPTAAAIANAVYDAIGVQINTCPLTPFRVLDALKEAKSQ
jgi:xanthine dehydrogenase YagR molybdenum-binding subunit